jgi:hypothetical protein
MGFFRRTLPEPKMGLLIDFDDHQRQVFGGSQPGLPMDGRYWVAQAESNGELSRLIWEHPATYYEAKALISQFGKTYRKKPRNASQVRIDDVNGLWYIEPRGKPYAMLLVVHPVTLRYPQSFDNY